MYIIEVKMFIVMLFAIIGAFVIAQEVIKQVKEELESPFCVSDEDSMINSLKYGIIIICVGLFLGLLSMYI